MKNKILMITIAIISIIGLTGCGDETTKEMTDVEAYRYMKRNIGCKFSDISTIGMDSFNITCGDVVISYLNGMSTWKKDNDLDVFIDYEVGNDLQVDKDFHKWEKEYGITREQILSAIDYYYENNK